MSLFRVYVDGALLRYYDLPCQRIRLMALATSIMLTIAPAVKRNTLERELQNYSEQ
jgi:hypothetical protein